MHAAVDPTRIFQSNTGSNAVKPSAGLLNSPRVTCATPKDRGSMGKLKLREDLFLRRVVSRPTSQSKCKSKTGFKCNALSGGVGNELVELPLFPLPLVLFPGSMLPLQIFEYRYRILMQTLLQTDMRFGIIYSGKENGFAASIGCVGEVVKYEKLVDDRYFLVCKGQERFRVVDIVRRRPYLVARVEWLEDRPSDQSQDLNALSDSVETLLKDVIRLSNKMKGSTEDTSVTDIRRSAFPTPFSFWVASMFESAPNEQQALLELTDTVSRLQREQETLRNTLNYLTAAAAVKEAFPDE